MIRETMDDRHLLDRYLATCGESAFRELVGRHLEFVHAVARRVTGNDEWAREAAPNTPRRDPGGVADNTASRTRAGMASKRYTARG